jgi:hypothetical protein
VASEEEKLVCYIISGLAVERLHVVYEPLPLSRLSASPELRISGIRLVDEAKVDSRLRPELLLDTSVVSHGKLT